jgi:hypothetical protein
MGLSGLPSRRGGSGGSTRTESSPGCRCCGLVTASHRMPARRQPGHMAQPADDHVLVRTTESKALLPIRGRAGRPERAEPLGPLRLCFVRTGTWQQARTTCRLWSASCRSGTGGRSPSMPGTAGRRSGLSTRPVRRKLTGPAVSGLAARCDIRPGHPNISVANGIPGSQKGSQRPQIAGYTRPHAAAADKAERHVRPRPAMLSGSSGVPPKRRSRVRVAVGVQVRELIHTCIRHYGMLRGVKCS